MKIIIEGDKELAEQKMKQTKRFGCRVCGCVFDADKSEYRYYEDYRESEYYYFMKCPCCGNEAKAFKKEEMYADDRT